MFWSVFDMFASVLFVVVFILSRKLHFCAADLCNWSGSGFPISIDTRMVLQVRLRCTEGSVRWAYPGQALRVVLEPNLSSSARRSTLCIKPSPSFGGASLFIERGGQLEPLVTDGGRVERVSCFSGDELHVPAIYIQTSLPGDEPWSPRWLGFRYELMANRSAAPSLDHTTLCRPCNDTELLMAVCNSDFVVRGFIKDVLHNLDRQISLVEVLAVKVHWQRSGVFEHQAIAPGSSGTVPSWRGVIRAHLQCGVKSGEGDFLFTGSEHFGDAWLGCAPRYKHFLSIYRTAKAWFRNPCDFPLD
ncbi:meteorin-like protein [Vanacampus margaritifer]